MEEIDQDDAKPTVTNVSDIVGDWVRFNGLNQMLICGKWQLNICMFCLTMAAFSALNNMAGSFYAPKTDFRCVSNNVTLDLQCPPPSSNFTCDYWEYDRSVFQRTIITEWDLVCDRAWLSSFTQSVYMFGVVISALLFGYLSDQFGRIKVLYAGIVLEILGGLCCIYSPGIVTFTLSRLLLSIGCYGRNLTGFLIGIECVGPKYRAKIGISYQLGWAFGYVLLPALAYVCRDYVRLLYCTTLPELVWLLWLWRIPESPKWLISKARYVQAEAVLKQALAFNGRSLENVKEQMEALRLQIERERMDRANQREVTFIDLWKNANIRNFTLILYFTWFVNAFVYYGISFNIGDFGGDLFVNFALAGLVEVPSYLFTIYAFDYVGRRRLTAMLMLLAGVCCLLILVCRQWIDSHSVTIGAAMLGKFAITSTFAIIYVYSAELYPTVLRQFAVGSCSIAGRVGSILAPFIKELSQVTSIGVSMGIFAFFSLLDGALVFLLPETSDVEMPDTLEEAGRIGHNRTQSKQELS